LDHVIAVSNELRSILIDEFAVSADRVSVRFNGIDPAKFHSRDQETARRSLGLASDRRILLHVGRLSIEKRHRFLLEAVARCPVRDFDVYLLGEGPLRREIEEQIKSRGLQDRVTLGGGISHDQLPDWFAAADLFCLSSAHEGCPVVVHEALACGVPVVSTRVGAVPDLVRSDHGVLCEPESPDALANALETAWSRNWDRQGIASYGATHSWDAVAMDLVRLYENLKIPR
jgi:glycosyltransferase involved in cell wall biosynthesis